MPERYARSVYLEFVAVGHAFLGFLKGGRQHGYSLKHDYDRWFSEGRDLKFGQVYATLGRLARDGLASVSIESGDGPDRKSYAITPDGVQELESWLDSPVAPEEMALGPLYTKVVVALVSGRPVDEVLTAQRAVHLVRMRELRTQQADAEIERQLASTFSSATCKQTSNGSSWPVPAGRSTRRAGRDDRSKARSMWLRSSVESVCEGPDDEHGGNDVGGGEYESCGPVGVNDDHRDHRERCQCAGDSDEDRAAATSPAATPIVQTRGDPARSWSRCSMVESLSVVSSWFMFVLLRGSGCHVVRRLTMTTNATTAEDIGDEDSLACGGWASGQVRGSHVSSRRRRNRVSLSFVVSAMARS